MMQNVDDIHERFKNDVQYPYADIGAPELMHISGITQENRHYYTYTCPYCKKGLRPRFGERRKHFAHKPGERCDLDKYIHTTAERLLKEKWERNEPFEITLKVRTECKDIDTCFFHKDYRRYCVFEETKTFDLKKQYTQCIVEKKFGEFIPDLCLIDETGKHKPIFIEIWSKHKNSKKKAESDNMIIEIRLKTALDLNILKHSITESETVTFSHFKTLRKSPKEGDGPHMRKYTLYANTLKSYVDDKTVFCGNYKTRHQAKSIFEVVCTQDEIYSATDFRNYCNAIAIDRGYDIRTCYLCQFYGEDKRNKCYDIDAVFNPNRPVGCRRDLEAQGLIECKPEDARTCQEFKLKDIPLNRLKEWHANVNRYIWFKNADGTVSEEIQKRKD